MEPALSHQAPRIPRFGQVCACLSPASIAPGVRTGMRAVEPELPTAEYQELADLIDRAVSPRRFTLWLLGAFATAALFACLARHLRSHLVFGDSAHS